MRKSRQIQLKCFSTLLLLVWIVNFSYFHDNEIKIVDNEPTFRWSTTPLEESNAPVGAIVVLAPPRSEISMWRQTPRFCFLMRAIRSVDQNLNRRHGPYPIFILVTKDHALDPRRSDGPYTERDRALIRSWAPNSNITFQEIDLYSNDALEPGTSVKQINAWRKGDDNATAGRDLGYQSMCRLWSGRLQTMKFLQKFMYYMRIDDDSLITSELPEDPFIKAEMNNLSYVWRRDSMEPWGREKIQELMRRHIKMTIELPFMHLALSGNDFQYVFNGDEPYNNFHISRVSFWSSPQWQSFWNDLNEEHAFFKHRVGDATAHAAAIMMMRKEHYQRWYDFPYAHNSNDMLTSWAPLEWREECEKAEKAFATTLY